MKKSIFGAKAVKHIPKQANSSPPKKATGNIAKNHGVEINPKAATTAKTIAELNVALVAPQRSSPAMTSSTLIGVAIIASNVR